MRDIDEYSPAKTIKECFFNEGVFRALEYAFKNPEFLYDMNSREYKELKRAYWKLCPLANIYWRPRIKKRESEAQAPSLGSK